MSKRCSVRVHDQAVPLLVRNDDPTLFARPIRLARLLAARHGRVLGIGSLGFGSWRRRPHLHHAMMHPGARRGGVLRHTFRPHWITCIAGLLAILGIYATALGLSYSFVLVFVVHRQFLPWVHLYTAVTTADKRSGRFSN